jgi:pimeloyl-ACP methyl ester carboxylesterase
MTTISSSLHLHVEQRGTGEPLVLVHGSWGSRERWALIEDDLARSFRVVTYDRRGHGHSDFGDPASTRPDDEADLAWVIESLGAGPVHVVGSSSGGQISLGAAARYPELFRSVSAHEPPLLELADDDELVQAAIADFSTAADMIEGGEPEAAAHMFVERVAHGPGGWEMMPPEAREAMVRNARAFAREARGPNWGVEGLASIEAPVLLTAGDSSPAWLTPVVAAAIEAMPQASALTILGAGHIPHITHPAEYVEILTRFARSASGG